MKSNRVLFIISAAVVLLSVTAGVGSQTFLGACIHEDGTHGACQAAARGVLGISLLITAQSALTLFLRNGGVRRGLFLAISLTAVLGILTPGTLLSLCSMATMRCQALMRPAMMILFSLMCLLSVAGALLAKGNEK